MPEPGHPERPWVTFDAPVGTVDIAAFDFDGKGNPWQIHACDNCLPWHAEVVAYGGVTYVREWHAVECPAFRQLLGEDVDPPEGRGE